MNRVRERKGAVIRREEKQKSRVCCVAGAAWSQRGGGQRCLREPINHSSRIKGSKDEKRRRTVGRTAGMQAVRRREPSSSFLSFCLCFGTFLSPSLLPSLEAGSFFIFSFSKFVGGLYCRGPKRAQEKRLLRLISGPDGLFDGEQIH